MVYSPRYVQEIMKNYEFYFKKKFGQNFIVDENIINSIINKSDIDKDTLVIEIGPGAGALTYKLCEHAGQVISYEIDITLKKILDNELKNYHNVNIIYEDFLKADVKSEIERYSFDKIYVVANLPYYITTPIIMKIIKDNLPVQKIVVMVQKEVGNRFQAKLGTKDYNSLSVYLDYYFDVKKILNVSKNVFYPKPNIDSVVVEMKKKQKKEYVKNEELFFKIIKDAFKQKRKTVKNNLKNYPLDKVEKILNKYHHDLTTRAEKISLEEFVDISNNL